MSTTLQSSDDKNILSKYKDEFIKAVLSFGFLALFVTNTVFFSAVLLFVLMYAYICSKKPLGNYVHKVCGLWGRSLFYLTPGWKVSLEGLSNLEKDTRATIIVANHESSIDILVIYFLQKQFRWLAKQEIFLFPLIGQAMKIAGYVSIKRGNRASHKQAMLESSKILKNKVSMLFFPEGTRSLLGRPQEFKKGAFRLAIDNDVPIQPIVLKGAGLLLKKGSLCPRKATVKVKILPALKHLPSDTPETYALKVQKIISEQHIKL